MSSQRYQEFIAERARLLERIKELEAENAELRKRLGEPATPMTQWEIFCRFIVMDCITTIRLMK